MKRFLSLLMSIVMLLSITAGLNMTAFAETIGDFEYTVLENGTVKITDYSGTETDLSIPSTLGEYTVTRIGEDAFYNCSSLTSVIIPKSVTRVEDYSFAYCNSLTTVTFSSNLNGLSEDTFYCCDNISVVNLTSAREELFCSEYVCFINDVFPYVREINISETDENYSSINGVVFNKDKTELVYFPIAKEGGYTIPNGTIIIDDSAFSGCSSLTSVTIPNSVTSIGYYAFEGCDGLTSITIPNSVTSIGDYAFQYCDSLTNVTIGNSVTSIGDGAFYETGFYNDLSNWKDGVLYLGSLLLEANTDFGFISNRYTVKDGTTIISAGAFRGQSSITEIIFPESLKIIGTEAFGWCTNLSNVKFPETIDVIGEEAFRNTALKEVTIPNGVKDIYWVFTNCPIEKMNIPASVVKIDPTDEKNYTNGAMMSSLQKLKEINVSPDNSVFTSVDGVLYSKDMTKLLHYPHKKTEFEFIVPDSVTEIERWAIGNNYWGYAAQEYLKSISLPNSLTRLNSGTIVTNRLEKITIPKSVEIIEQYAIDNYDFDTDRDIPFTVYGYINTEAQKYANQKGYKFVDLDNLTTSDPSNPGGGPSGGGSTSGGGGGGFVPAPTPDEPATKPTTEPTTKPENNTNNTTTTTTTKNPATVTITKPQSKKKSVVVTWKAASNVSGYEVQIATDKKFKKNKKSVKINKKKASKKTFKKLKSNKKYYVRVRSYKIVNGKKVYGKWSKVKSVKTK